MVGSIALQLVDEGWKLSSSKKGFGSRSVICSSSSSSRRGGGCGGGDLSGPWNPPVLSRSSSCSCSAASTSTGTGPTPLRRQGSSVGSSSSSRAVRRSSSLRYPSSSSSSSFTRRCAKLVKEQGARFYIVRRCVTMLVCWKDYAEEA